MDARGLSPAELLLAVVLGSLAAVGSVVWCGAWLAASVTGAAFHATLQDALAATVHLPKHVADPSSAWPERSSSGIPGPLAYWASTAVVAMAASAIGVTLVRLVGHGRVGSARRLPLGVDARASFATRRD